MVEIFSGIYTKCTDYLRDIFEAFRYMNPSVLCFPGSFNVELARIPVFALNLGFVFFVCAVTIVTLPMSLAR